MGIPQGAYNVNNRCRGPALVAKHPQGDKDSLVTLKKVKGRTTWDQAEKLDPEEYEKFNGSCRQQGPLGAKKAKYQAQLKEFVNIARGAGVERIIWFGPSYMSGVYGNVPFKVTHKMATRAARRGYNAGSAVGAQVNWGPSGLEEGAKNVRLWQKETLTELNVEWYDSAPMTRDLPNLADGLHWDHAAYKKWAVRAWTAAFGGDSKAKEVLARADALKAAKSKALGLEGVA